MHIEELSDEVSRKIESGLQSFLTLLQLNVEYYGSQDLVDVRDFRGRFIRSECAVLPAYYKSVEAIVAGGHTKSLEWKEIDSKLRVPIISLPTNRIAISKEHNMKRLIDPIASIMLVHHTQLIAHQVKSLRLVDEQKGCENRVTAYVNPRRFVDTTAWKSERLGSSASEKESFFIKSHVCQIGFALEH